MAATLAPDAGIPFPIYGVPTRINFCIFDINGAEVTGAAGLDSEIQLDGDTVADCTNEAAADGSGWYSLVLTAAEMLASHVSGRTKTSTTDALSAMWELYPAVLPVLLTGTAAAGAAATITLAAGPDVDDALNGQIVVTTGGTGSGQARIITNYVASTKVATVSPAWATQPSNDTTYNILQSPIALPLTAITEDVQSGLATSAALATVDGIADDIKAVTVKLDTALVLDGAEYKLTANALEEAPTGGAPDLSAITDVTDKLDTAMQLDGSVYRFTANALELAPTSGATESKLETMLEADGEDYRFTAGALVHASDLRKRIQHATLPAEE